MLYLCYIWIIFHAWNCVSGMDCLVVDGGLDGGLGDDNVIGGLEYG